MVARSLLEHETIDGATVKRLIAMAATDPQPSVESTSVD